MSETKPKRVAFWNRMSHEFSVQRESHINHRMRAEEFCRFKGYDLVKEYTLLEVPGAKIRSHAAYHEYRRDVREGKIDALLVTTLKRFARKVKILIEEIDFLRKHNVDFISMGESTDTTTPYGKLIFVIISGLAELESDEISERINASIKPRALRSMPLSGMTPLGYRWVDRRLTICEPEAEVVRKAFDWFIEIGNLNPTCHRLNAAGFKAKRGEFSNTTLRRLLTCTAYVGKHLRNYRGTKDGTWFFKDEKEHIVNDCPSVIDNSTWGKAQDTLARIAHSQPPKRMQNSYLLSGLLQHVCGGKLYGTTYKDERWAKYSCKKCYFATPMGDFDRAVAAVLFDVILRTDYFEDLLKDLGADPAIYRQKAWELKGLFEVADTKEKNLLLKTLISKIEIDGSKIRMRFWDLPHADKPPTILDLSGAKHFYGSSSPTGHPSVEDDPALPPPPTIQVFPGNPQDKTGFVFEFDMALSGLFGGDFRSRLATYPVSMRLDMQEIDKMAGLADGSVSAFIKGKRTPTWLSVQKLSKALKVDPNELLNGLARTCVVPAATALNFYTSVVVSVKVPVKN